MYSIIPIQAFSDNYIWLLVNNSTNECICIDPGDAEPVINYLKQHQLKLVAILITHHHWDHINGIESILSYQAATVYGPSKENIPYCTHTVSEGDQITIESWQLSFSVGEIPGHTIDHIFYYCKPWLFCGDTLFSVGCGRIFEGTAEQMYNSLTKINQLPGETEIYCAHEYTKNNIKFAMQVEPKNQNLINYAQYCQQQREHSQPTLPSHLTIERQCNPFLRCSEPTVVKSAEQYCGHKLTTPVQVFAIIRQWKDNF